MSRLFFSLVVLPACLVGAVLLCAACFAFQRVTPENVSLRARLICEGAHLGAPLVSESIVRVLLTNVDCRCVIKRMTDQNFTVRYADVFEAYRKAWAEKPAAWLPPWHGPLPEPEIDAALRVSVLEHIGAGVFMCQRAR